METLRKPKYEWENRVPFSDRQFALCKYLEGYAVKPIADWLRVSNTTVEYHLIKEGVYVKRRKATMFTKTNPFPPRHTPVVQRVLTDKPVVKQDNEERYFDDRGEECRWPKSYKQLVQDARKIEKLKLAQYKLAKALKDAEEQAKPKGFTVRVSIVTGHTTIRQPDGSYIDIQSTGPTQFYTSTNLISW